MDVELEEIPLDTAVADLGEHTLVEFTEGLGVLTVVGRGPRAASAGVLDLRLRGTGWNSSLKGVDAARCLGDVAAFARASEPLRAFRLPKGTVTFELSHQQGVGEGRVPLLIVGSLFTGILLTGVLHSVWEGGLGFMIGLVILTSMLGGAVMAGMRLVSSGEVGYRIDGVRMKLAELPLPLDVETAIRQVEAVKEEYGQLLTDLAYRIEHPALFDAASPATERLTLALFEWDTTVTGLDDAARVELARTVVASFEEARDHAERVGMAHLPEDSRELATRALKAARVAQDPGAGRAEREAARRVAIDLLAGLALYYLPTPDEARVALGGRRLRQLPGRRAS